MADEQMPHVSSAVAGGEHLGLIELVHRVLDRGAVITGDVVISVAGVDLVYVGLRVLLSSVETMESRQLTALEGPGGSRPELDGAPGPDPGDDA